MKTLCSKLRVHTHLSNWNPTAFGDAGVQLPHKQIGLEGARAQWHWRPYKPHAIYSHLSQIRLCCTPAKEIVTILFYRSSATRTRRLNQLWPSPEHRSPSNHPLKWSLFQIDDTEYLLLLLLLLRWWCHWRRWVNNNEWINLINLRTHTDTKLRRSHERPFIVAFIHCRAINMMFVPTAACSQEMSRLTLVPLLLWWHPIIVVYNRLCRSTTHTYTAEFSFSLSLSLFI